MFKIAPLLLLSCLTLTFSAAHAQVSDNFSDGDFTGNPTWTGSAADWIINTDNQLQSNNTTANASFSITTPSTLATTAEWNFYVRLAFNTSSANYVDVYLTSSSTNLGTSNTGYFVRLGGTDDEICLYRKDAGISIKLIDGVNGILNTSNNIMRIRVVRTANGGWILSRDLNAGGTYIPEGAAIDTTYTSSSYFGILVKQSTASFFQKHFFGDFDVKPYLPDVTPPSIKTVAATSATVADILFSEAVDTATATVVTNYTAGSNLGNPSSATIDATNPALVHLVFTTAFPVNATLALSVSNIKDVAGNALTTATASFGYFVTMPYDVLIDELFPDPTPVVGLPNAEFIELKNVSNRSISLQGWHLSSLSTTSGAFPDTTLQPDSFLIVTGTSAAALFAPFGKVVSITSFPSLTNDGATLTLVSKEGVVVHSVSYSASWYQNAVKSDGGWTLEMIDTKNPCSGATNWKASTDNKGGTPGAKNSVDGNNPDGVAPALIRAATIDSANLLLTFDEPVDVNKSRVAANYTISNSIGVPLIATPLPPSYRQVQLALPRQLVAGTIYTITVSNVTDCSGNTIQALNTAKLGLASPPDSFDVVINEILFNPKPGGVDYLELYNRSNKIIDLKNLYIANRSSSGTIGSLSQLTAESVLVFPGDFYVLSADGSLVKQFYTVKNPGNFIDVTMPSMSDDQGDVLILNNLGRIVDELAYSHNWHSPIVDNEEGISLERIDYDKPTQDPQNWFSAASTAGFGTPSYKNSQFRADASLQGDITITPRTFSPDNDGYDDFAIISYKMPEAGDIANITIFDATGRAVKALVKNATLSQTGSFRWDGLDDKSFKVPVGVYVLYTEIFNLDGKKKTYKNTVIVAKRF